MELKSKYIVSENVKDVLSVIKRSLGKKDNIIWQNVLDKRRLFSIASISLYPKTGMIKVFVKDPDARLVPEKDAYIKLHFRESVFKVRVLHVDGSLFTLQVPPTVHSREYRKEPRFFFHTALDKYVTLAMEVPVMSSSSQLERVKTLDISRSGMCLFVETNFISLLKGANSISLMRLTQELSTPRGCDVVYIKRARFKINGKVVTGYRVGFKFDELLDKKAFDKFIGVTD